MNFRSRFFFVSRIAHLAVFALWCGALSACGAIEGLELGSDRRIIVMTYNTQAFFDAIEDGTEFSEYRGMHSRWSQDKYIDRLDRLREVLLLCGSSAGLGRDRGPDIVVLQEIENDRVLHDICNRLPRQCPYPFAAFVPPDKGCAFGTAVLSRYPVESVTVHSIDESEAALRPLLEVRLTIGQTPLVLFAVHWKSKSDNIDTVRIRLAQESLLNERMAALERAEPQTSFIACGDFNQTLEEFTLLKRVSNCWDDWLKGCAAGKIPGPVGSYCFQGNWETIDNIFVSDSLRDGKGLEAGDFSVVSAAPLTGLDAMPARYELFSGAGYSDHLPLILELRRLD